MDTVTKGRDFEEKVYQKLKEIHKCTFNKYSKIPIGNPPKLHKFDLVSEDKSIIVECKDNNWSKTDEVPSGKIATMLKEILHFNKGPKDTKNILVLRKYYSEKRKKTLGDYFVSKYKYLLEGITVMELDIENMKLEEIFPND